MTNTTTAAGNTPGRPAARPIVATQLTALEALIVIGRTCATLPAAHFEVGAIYPDEVRISLHHDLPAFEAWRAALRIPEDDVNHRTYDGQMSLTARTTMYGATVELVGYAPALPEPDRGGQS
jgi:hypothetical protein